MEIQGTLLQTLTQLVTNSWQQPSTSDAGAASPGDPSPGPVVAQPAVPEEPLSIGEAVRDDNGNGILTSGEKEILTLFFNGQAEADVAVYSAKPPKPAIFGNFVDVRG